MPVSLHENLYANFFGLAQAPFSIAPDPRYLYMSERHREALAHLLYGISAGGGFVLLSGDIGAGKTTVCRCFLEQVPTGCNVAYIFNPKLTVAELLGSICDEFGVRLASDGRALSVKEHVDPLNEFLLRSHAAGRNNVLIIDEAQNLSVDVLEQLRLLTNLETSERKLLQIILIGQPELRTLLEEPALEQLAQRVIARFHLEALSASETEGYVRHRMSVAGLKGPLPFDDRTLQRIHQLARGVPRRINLLSDRSLLGAYALGRHHIDRAVVDKAAAEVFGPGESAALARTRSPRPGFAIAALLAIVIGGGLWVTRTERRPRAVAALRMVPAAASAASASPDSAGNARLVAVRTASAPAAAAQPAVAVDLPATFDAAAHDERTAWRELARAWRVSLPVDGDPCEAARRQQVECFRSSGSTLSVIRTLDRPGWLTLHDNADRPVYALLTGLTATTATVRIGEAVHTVSLQSLADAWRGDFATLWRVPPGYSGGVVGAGSGAVTEWLVAQLDRVQTPRGAREAAAGASAASATDGPTEPALRARVTSFQLAQGLRADGLAGPTTFMQLNRSAGIDEPHLLADATPN